MITKASWIASHLGSERTEFPFSFIFDGRQSNDLLGAWKFHYQEENLDRFRLQRTFTYTAPQTGLLLRCVAVEYTDFPVVEWTVYLKNTGKEDTPILENIQGLDTRFERNTEKEFILHGIKGDWCEAESFQPFEMTLNPDSTKCFSPPEWSGKSCDGPDGWPYYNLQMQDGGIIIAVGWPGQWEASFVRDHDRGLRIVAGQQRTRLYLKPGEEIRTPLIALLWWEGTNTIRAQNIWRRWFLAHNIPRVNDEPQPPITQIQVDGSIESFPGVIETYLQTGIKPDICWTDAGWYPKNNGPHLDNSAWLNTGTWEPDPIKYPHGFKPFSDRVHAQGMKFLLWFEPERVGDPNSWLGQNHPEWLLPNDWVGSILNEGNPDALTWLIDHVDGLIKSQGIDWYREDMNGSGPLTAWRKNDSDNRQGITENFYIQGHLAFWDELKKRNPGLSIDSCASGGRRNDLETMRRSVPLLRSDFQFPHMKNVIEGNQGHTYGLSSWLPWYGSGVYFTDTYAVRSFLMPGFGVVPPKDWEQSDQTRAVVKKAYDECREVASCMLGDYYPLTPYSLQLDRWIAWQFNRPEKSDGIVQVFRRKESPYVSAAFKLHDLDPKAAYIVTNLDAPETPIQMTGQAIMETGLPVTLTGKPQAAIFIYRKKIT